MLDNYSSNISPTTQLQYLSAVVRHMYKKTDVLEKQYLGIELTAVDGYLSISTVNTNDLN